MGNTTTVIRIATALKEKGMKVGGIVSREIRTNKMRTGFEFVDLPMDNRNVLASVTGNGPKVGKYFVSLSGCRFAVKSMQKYY